MTVACDYKKYAILYVDDEETALKYFSKGMGKDFRVLTAPSVADALTILEREGATIGVVITDQRMPNQYGVELLKKLREKWPAIIRLLITAYSDIESAVEAVNSGAIFKYITKPADFKTLKETLKAAMELFWNNAERDTLLKERLDVMQRMVVADRVRSLAMMAGGISHHLRNSMTALTCFLEEAAPAKPGESPANLIASDPKFAEQLWSLANKEREHLLKIVQSVGQGVAEPAVKIAGDLDAAELFRKGSEAASADLGGRAVQIQPLAQPAQIKLDDAAATRLIRILITYAARLSKPDGKVSISAVPLNIGQAPALSICVNGEGPAWSEADVASFFTPFAFPASDPSDLGLDLLSAFTIAYHHGGDIEVHPNPPQGPGFELHLPLDPATVRRPDLQDGMLLKLFTAPQPPAAGNNPSEKAA